MVPKKASEFIKPTAEATQSSEDLVQDFVSFYWAEVRKALVDMKGHNVFVENLGTFKVKTWKLAAAQETYKGMIAKYQEKQDSGMVTFQRFAIMKDLEASLAKLDNVQQMVEQDRIKKQTVKDKRNGSKTNLDTPETDI